MSSGPIQILLFSYDTCIKYKNHFKKTNIQIQAKQQCSSITTLNPENSPLANKMLATLPWFTLPPPNVGNSSGCPKIYCVNADAQWHMQSGNGNGKTRLEICNATGRAANVANAQFVRPKTTMSPKIASIIYVRVCVCVSVCVCDSVN